MSSDTKKLIEICEQLPDTQKSEVVVFALDLLKKSQAGSGGWVDNWLKTARGAATTNMTTDEIMRLTRGEE